MILFLFLNKNICCGYSLEVLPQGTINEYPQHMFLFRNKKNVSSFWTGFLDSELNISDFLTPEDQHAH